MPNGEFSAIIFQTVGSGIAIVPVPPYHGDRHHITAGRNLTVSMHDAVSRISVSTIAL